MFSRPQAYVKVMEKDARTVPFEEVINFGSDSDICDVTLKAKNYDVGLHATLRYDKKFLFISLLFYLLV
jgi:hypothetical protein